MKSNKNKKKLFGKNKKEPETPQVDEKKLAQMAAEESKNKRPDVPIKDEDKDAPEVNRHQDPNEEDLELGGSLETQLTQDYHKKHPLDEGDIHAIINRLKYYSPDSAEVLVEAMVDEKNVKTLVRVLEENEGFNGYPTWHNHDIAVIAANEIASYGLINNLIEFKPKDPSDQITDISFNGKFMVLATNNRRFRYGRRKGHEDEPIINEKTVLKLVNKFSNKEGEGGSNFGPGNPSLDAFSNNMRLNAIDPTLSATGITMSLRVSKASLALNRKNFKYFAPNIIYKLLAQFVKGGANIMISGATGTGKTELLKLLVDEVAEDDKIIMIEDVQETHLQEIYPTKNIYDWITTPQFTIKDHVKNALRNQPDWVLVSETRGAEAYEMYQLFLTGHPVLTTLHATSNEAVPDRLYGMCSMSDFKIPEQLKDDLYTYLNIGVHITRKVVNGKVYRYADNICEFGDPNETYPGTDKLIYPHGIHTLYSCELIAEEDSKGNIRDSHGKIVNAPERITHFYAPTPTMVRKIYESSGNNLYEYYNQIFGTAYTPHNMYDHAQDFEDEENEHSEAIEQEQRIKENEDIRQQLTLIAKAVGHIQTSQDLSEKLNNDDDNKED